MQLDLHLLHARARNRGARIALEEGLEDAAHVLSEEGLAAHAEVLPRLAALLAWAEGGVDAVVLDGREPEEGAYGWFVLRLDGRLTLVTPADALREGARLVARLGAEPRAAALLGADVEVARREGLLARPHSGGPLPLDAALAYGPPGAEQDVMAQVLWSGAQPLATVRLGSPRPLVAATGDPVEAAALAAAMVD